jgi:TRAP-type C4-dicarboxylate transport system permease small subunit
MLQAAIKLYNGLVNGGAAVAGIIFLFMMALVCVDVVLRYIFNNPLGWVVEVCEYLLLYVTFLGSAWLLRNRGHVRVDILLSYLPAKTTMRMNVATSLLGAVSCLFLVIFGIETTWDAFVRGIPEIKTLSIPKWTLFWIIPFGSLLLFIEFLLEAKRVTQEPKQERTA